MSTTAKKIENLRKQQATIATKAEQKYKELWLLLNKWQDLQGEVQDIIQEEDKKVKNQIKRMNELKKPPGKILLKRKLPLSGKPLLKERSLLKTGE